MRRSGCYLATPLGNRLFTLRRTFDTLLVWLGLANRLSWLGQASPSGHVLGQKRAKRSMSSSKARAIEAVIEGRTVPIAVRKSSVFAGECRPPSDRSNAACAALRAANSMSAAEKYCER